jgi:aldehyde:ferredoxin oxidoreductase
MYEAVGKKVTVNLTSGLCEQNSLAGESIDLFLGSRGINAKILWETTDASTRPFDPENPLIFGAGTLTGTAAPCTGRTSVTSISPATGIYLKTNVGGHWGGIMRQAGVQTLVVTGKSSRPVYLYIDETGVSIRDASKYWGMTVREADQAIKKDLGDQDVQTAMIGPAGEKLVRFASIMFSLYSAAGRGGIGAVMGDKNLKAVVVKGGKGVTVNDPAAYQAAAEKAAEAIRADSEFEGLSTYGTADIMCEANEAGLVPSYNFKKGKVPGIEHLSGRYLTEGGFLKRRVSCYSCIIGCHRFAGVDHGPYRGTCSGGPEYETLAGCGAGCGIFEMEPVIRANALCNDYGIDTISTAGVIQWAMECYQRGILSKEDCGGIALKWGSVEALLKMIELIARRKGLGDLLAEGTKRAAEEVGHDSQQWAVQAKGLEQSRVETRLSKGYALSFAVNPRGVDHLMAQVGAEFGGKKEAVELVEKICGDVKYALPETVEKKPELVVWHEDCYAVSDCLGFCSFVTTAIYGVTPALMAELFNCAIGAELGEAEIMKAGRRVCTLEKCFNIRRGLDRKDDVLPYRLMNESVAGREGDRSARNSREELDGMLDRYYELHGWDLNTSYPLESTLHDLDLGFVLDDPLIQEKLFKKGRNKEERCN